MEKLTREGVCGNWSAVGVGVYDEGSAPSSESRLGRVNDTLTGVVLSSNFFGDAGERGGLALEWF